MSPPPSSSQSKQKGKASGSQTRGNKPKAKAKPEVEVKVIGVSCVKYRTTSPQAESGHDARSGLLDSVRDAKVKDMATRPDHLHEPILKVPRNSTASEYSSYEHPQKSTINVLKKLFGIHPSRFGVYGEDDDDDSDDDEPFSGTPCVINQSSMISLTSRKTAGMDGVHTFTTYT